MISLVLPTKNRWEFVERLLGYYKDVEFDGTICIGDSSNGEDLVRNKQTVKNLKGSLNIIYQEYPDLANEPQCTQQLIKLINTPYAAFVGDDDFLVPSSLKKCIQFLENNPEYSAAHGVAVRIETKEDKVCGQIISCRERKQVIEEGESASQRFLNFMKHADDVQYSVHRTQILSLMYGNASTYKDDKLFSATIQPYSISVISGKIKQLDCLYLLRQSRNEINRYTSLEQMNTYVWITSINWLFNINVYRNSLVNELMRQDEITLENAQNIVEQGFTIFLANKLLFQCKNYYPEYSDAFSSPLEKKIKFITNLIPGTKLILKKLYKLIFNSRKKDSNMSLQSLLKPSSPYHKDFMPIYRAITEENE